jgi:hypothetical protein
MLIKAAREELEMSIETREYECVGAQWGYKYDGEWITGWQGTKRIVKRSLQLCFTGTETFPSPQAYAAQANWNKSMGALLSKEPDWRTRKMPKASMPPLGAWNQTQEIYTLLKKKQPKWEGFSFMPKGEVV